MSEIKYGLISSIDARTLEKTIDLIIADIKSKDERYVFITEIGLFNCESSIAIKKYLNSNGVHNISYTGIDNEKDKPIDAPEWMNYIKGNSNEVYNQLEDNSQHLIFVDGCHCFAHVISDFFCYADKVKVGGYMAFHDTGKHIAAFKDFQHGDKDNPDAFISVRKALDKIGLLEVRYIMQGGGHGVDESGLIPITKHFQCTKLDDWELIFDEADETNEAGGITVFKKLD